MRTLELARILVVVTLLASACEAPRSIRYRNLPDRDPSLPFSHVADCGDTVYVAGTLGLDANGAPPADPADEARLALEKIRAKLALAGLGMDDLVAVQVFCSDLELYGTFNDVYRTFFDGEFPTRAFVGSGPLLRGARFEVLGTAVRP